jgi:hypothetical protein
MPIVKIGIKPASIQRFLLAFIAFIGAQPASLTANGQTAPTAPPPPNPPANAHSDYSLSTSSTTLNIPYLTYLNNWTGKTQLGPVPVAMPAPILTSPQGRTPVTSPQDSTTVAAPQTPGKAPVPATKSPPVETHDSTAGHTVAEPSHQAPTSQSPSTQGPGTVAPIGSQSPETADPSMPPPAPTTLEIAWNNSSGVPSADWIRVTFEVSYNGVKGKYNVTRAIQRKGGAYTIDQNIILAFRGWLINNINNCPAPSTDPNAVLVLDKPVSVTVTPVAPIPGTDSPPALFSIAAGWDTGKPVQTTNNLTVTFEHVFGP